MSIAGENGEQISIVCGCGNVSEVNEYRGNKLNPESGRGGETQVIWINIKVWMGKSKMQDVVVLLLVVVLKRKISERKWKKTVITWRNMIGPHATRWSLARNRYKRKRERERDKITSEKKIRSRREVQLVKILEREREREMAQNRFKQIIVYSFAIIDS